MSYCRFSSDCWQSDVYVYESAEGFNIHVAGRRYVSDQPRPEFPKDASADNVMAYWKACDEWVEKAHAEDINFPAGDHYVSPILVQSQQECIDKLMELRGMGYRIPQQAIDALQDEIAVKS